MVWRAILHSLLSPAVQTLGHWKFTDFATPGIFFLLNSFYSSAERDTHFSWLAILHSLQIGCSAFMLAVYQLLSGHPGGRLDCCIAYGVCMKTCVQFLLNLNLHTGLCSADGRFFH